MSCPTIIPKKINAKKSNQICHKKQSTREVGNITEAFAKTYLEKHGLIALFEQYRTPCGEIDLIMRDQDEIVFVEVRYRENNEHGEPHETVTRSKQQKLIRAAQYFSQQHDWVLAYNLRIDVVGILGDKPKYKITWIPNAIGVK